MLWIVLIGALDGNLAWWPGGALVWAIPFAATLGACAWGLSRLDRPKAIWLRLGLLVFVLHGLIDLDHHSWQLWGSALVLAALLAPPAQARLPLAVAPLAALVTALVLIAGMLLGAARERASAVGEALLLMHQPEHAETATADLAALTDGKDPWLLLAMWIPWEPTLVLRSLPAKAPGRERLGLSSAVVASLPMSANAHRRHAEDLLAGGDRDAAIAAAREAVRCAPGHLDHRRFLVRLLRDPVERQAAQAELDRLAPIAHPSQQ